MKLEELQKHWDEFGKRDPLWAILTVPENKDGKWDPVAFFKNGEEDVDNVLNRVESLGLSARRGHALDFGCGVGRLTQALGRLFDESTGIDIAPSMIELARKYNRHGDKCRYWVNAANDLHVFRDAYFDFIYSVIVLQHMQPDYSQNYIREFLRVLAPGGVLVFQLPSERAPERPPLSLEKSASNVAGSTAADRSIDNALPAEVFRAEIVLQSPSLTVRAGCATVVNVKVRNVSSLTWPAGDLSGSDRPLRLGNHWLDSNQEMLVRDDGREELKTQLKPQEQVELSLQVTAPANPGNYVLEFDLVQERVAWFKDKGSQTTQLQCRVTGSQDKPARLGRRLKRWLTSKNDVSAVTPKMEMYAVHKDTVLTLIREAGGRVVDVQADTWAGPAWHSLTYFVTK